MNHHCRNRGALLPSICWLFFFLIAVTNSYSAERLAVALLPPHCESADANFTHWQFEGNMAFEKCLTEIKGIHILPESSINYAYRELHLQVGQSLSTKQLCQLGRTIEAQQVVYCTYQPEKEGCKITAWVVHTATGKESTKWTTTSGDWLDAGLELSQNILSYLNISPTSDELARMQWRPTRSKEALELFARAIAENHQGKPLALSESLLVSALKQDPNFSSALRFMAALKAMQGKLDEATEAAKKAISIRPIDARAHYTLGKIYVFKEEPFLGQTEFLEAIRLDPDDAASYQELSTFFARRKKWDEALKYLEKSKETEPYKGTIHAELARANAYHGERDKALAELKIAENLFTDETTEQMVGETYAKLNETPRAVEHYEKFVKEMERRGAVSSIVDEVKDNLRELKKRITLHPVVAEAPKESSQIELMQNLSQILAKEDMKLVVYPMSCTPEMRKWARELIGDAKGEQEKAERIFQGLKRHIDLGDDTGHRTAEETYKEWSNPETRFTCQEYTLLYMALAREVGLKTFFVLVTKDYRDHFVHHACAGVFVEGKALMVDPTYTWFGVPHKEYRFLNDQEVVSIFMCQLGSIESSRVASRIAPELAPVQFNLAIDLAESGRVSEAIKPLENGLKLDSNNWFACYSQGAVAAARQHYEDAVMYLQKSLSFDPESPKVHCLLARTYQLQGKLKEAREEYRTYLQGRTEPELRDAAREAIVAITEQLNKQAPVRN